MPDKDTTGNRKQSGTGYGSEGSATRRGVLGGLLMVAAAAGVAWLLEWQYITRPEVVDLDITRRDGQENVYTVVVANDGGPSGVLVILTLRDVENNVLVRREKEMTVSEGEQREVEFLIDTPAESDEFQAEVEGADFPERLAS